MHAPTTRRAVLAAAAGTAAALAATGCTKYGDGGNGANEEPPPAKEPATAPPASNGQSAPKPPPLTATSDIPVGGGKVFPDEKVVVTQPEAGSFKAFSATCTHQGCTVSSVAGGTINCPCHGSKYRIADASVAGGPAPRPLPPRAITVENGSIRLA